MPNPINAITDRQAQILAVTFQLQICVESLAMAIKWLADDPRSNNLEREMVTVVKLADETRDDLHQLQVIIWAEFAVGELPDGEPAND